MPPISQNSKAVFTIGSLLSLLGSVVYGTWQLADARNQILNELAAIRKTQSDQWSMADHERWAVKFERANRSANLIVPGVNDRPGS